LTAADLVAGNVVTLRLELTSGTYNCLAMDDLNFQEVHTDGVPETSGIKTLLTETWENSGNHAKLPNAKWPDWVIAGGEGPEINGSDWWQQADFAEGIYPTDVGFLGWPDQTVTKTLSGADSTFVAGRVYTLQFDAFGSGKTTVYPTTPTFWRGTLLADGSPVAADNWFSDEFSGKPGIPANRVITVDSSHDGLTTCKIIYRATAADAGKTIGVQLSGDDFSIGGLTATGERALYDNISLVLSLYGGTRFRFH
jgi:hypothetical protein